MAVGTPSCVLLKTLPSSTLLLLIGSQSALLQLHTACSHCFSKTGSHIFLPHNSPWCQRLRPPAPYRPVLYLPSQDPGLFLYSVNMQGALPTPTLPCCWHMEVKAGRESQALCRPPAPRGQDDLMSIIVTLLGTWGSIKSLSLCLRIYTRILTYLLVPSFGD